MKAFIISLLCALTFIAQGQKLQTEEIKIKLTKPGKKALKNEAKGKADFTNYGRYTNGDTSEFYTVYLHQYKDEPMQYEIHTVNENAESAEVKTGQFTPGFLKAYGVEKVEEDAIDRVPKVSNDQYAYMRRRPLALKGPEVRVGHFEKDYYKGVWRGFDFVVDEEYDLEEIFWPDIKVPVVEGGLSNSNYLLAARTNFSKILEGDRNYLPADGKILAAGPSSIEEQNQYLYGIYDLKTRKWDKKQVFTFDAKTSSITNYVLTNNGVLGLLRKDDQPHLIFFTREGEIGWQKTLKIDNHKKYIHWKLTETDKGSVIVTANKNVGSQFNPKLGLEMWEVVADEIENHVYFDYEELKEKVVAAPKSDVKFKKLPLYRVVSLSQTNNGNRLLVIQSGNGEGILQLDGADNTLKHFYLVDAVPHHTLRPTRRGPNNGYQKPLLEEIENGVYYYIVRNTPEALTLGVHKAESSSTAGNIKTITTHIYRVDETQTRFNVHKINLNSGEVSRAFEGEEYIMYGDDPVTVTKSGKLYIPCLLGSDYHNILIE